MTDETKITNENETKETDKANESAAASGIAERDEITLPLIRGNDDVTVTLNGVNYQIKRGECVSVPRSVALILERSEKQSRAARELVDRLSRGEK